ncbi:MAG: sensor histidine kinase [Gemmatimonadales bacterium]
MDAEMRKVEAGDAAGGPEPGSGPWETEAGPVGARDSDLARELDSLLVIGELVGRIAHGVNNPLAGIRNSFLLIKGAVEPDHPHFRYVDAIEREIQRIATLTRRLADNYRAEADAAVGVPIATIVGDAVRQAEAALGDAAGRVDADLRGMPGDFHAPAGLLRHGIQQLVEAALRATPAPGRVVVRGTVADGVLAVTIRYPATAAAPTATLRHARRLFSSLAGEVACQCSDGTGTLAAYAVTGVEASEPATARGKNSAGGGEDR